MMRVNIRQTCERECWGDSLQQAFVSLKTGPARMQRGDFDDTPYRANSSNLTIK